MHVIQPTWLAHGGDLRDFEVYSCHVSPDGKRLASAGGDGYIRIWSIEAIQKSADPTFVGPRQLAAVSNHTGTIHTVRFSPNNKYLASGADDKIVCVYSIEPGKPAAKVFGNDEAAPIENWRATRRLIGHDNDVQDLGWSCDSSILVSVGLDSKVVIWSGYTFEKLKTLGHHSSHVKGIAFDPANKYFATASDDRTVKIYRFSPPGPNSTAQDQVGNFVLEQTVKAPFEGSPLTTYFRRCSWSPDGNHIAAANAVNGPVMSVAIIDRGTWESEINLIGHEGPVEVCAFSPRLFFSEPPTDEHDSDLLDSALTVIACAGQDKTITVWNTSLARPFVILQEATKKSVSDLAWAPDGQTLYISSLDGAIIVAHFQDGELGYVAPDQVRVRSLERFGGGRRARLLESVDGAKLEEANREAEARGVDERLGKLMGGETVTATTTTTATAAAPLASDKADGKIANGERAESTNSANADPTPTTNGSSGTTKGGNSTTNASATATTTTAADSSSNAAPAPKSNGTAPAEATPTPNPTPDSTGMHKYRVTITKDGRKKIRPVLISGSADQMSTLPASQTVTQAPTTTQAEAGHAAIDLSKPYDKLPYPGIEALIFGNRRNYAAGQDRSERRAAAVTREGGAAILADGRGGLQGIEGADSISIAGMSIPTPIVSPALMVSRLRLATPTVRSLVQRTADGSAPDDRSATPTLSLHNNPKLCTRVTCTTSSRQIWTDNLPRPVLLATGNDNLWAAGCDDSSIIVWSPAGRRLFAPLILDAAPVLMDCCGTYLLVISAVGMLHVWDVRLMRALHPPVSLAPILDAVVQESSLTKTPSVVFARMTSAGTAVVALSNGTAYTYSSQMAVWQRVSEPWWAMTSQYWNTSPSIAMTAPSATTSDLGFGVIPFLERHTTTHALVRGRSFFLQRLVKSLLVADGFDGLEMTASVGHLETRLASALALGARDEFKAYLLTYAKRIGAERMGDRVQEVLDGLVCVDDDGTDDGGDGDDADRAGNVDADDVAASTTRPRQNGDQTRKDTTGPTTNGIGPAAESHARWRQQRETMSEQLSSAWMGDGPRLCGWRRRDLLADVLKVLGKYRDLHRLILPYARFVGLVRDDVTGLDWLAVRADADGGADADVRMDDPDGLASRSRHR